MDYDLYYDKVSLLLPMTGANNSTTFIDQSSHNKTPTLYGGAKIVQSAESFDGGSGYFSGSSILSYADSADFGFSMGDFTVEFITKYKGGDGYRCFLNIHGDGNYLYYGLNTGTKNQFIWNNELVMQASSAISNNVFQHHAICRKDGVTRIFRDGVIVASGTWSVDLASSRTCLVGGETVYPSQGVVCYMNYLRITKYARYVENFTPTVGPLPTRGPQYVLSGPLARFSDGVIADLVTARLSSTGAIVGSTTPNPTTGAFSLTIPNQSSADFDVMIQKTGYRPLIHGPISATAS